MYKNILLSIDLNEESSWTRALPAALELCSASKAKLTLVTIVPEFGMAVVGSAFPPGYEAKMRDEAKVALQAFADKHVPAEVSASIHVGHGSIYREILQVAASIGADLIVMASHRPELRDYLLGPNAARVVRHSPTSVLVVR